MQLVSCCPSLILMVRSLRTSRTVFLLQVGFLLVSAFARSFQAYAKWPDEPSSNIDRSSLRYTTNVPTNQSFNLSISARAPDRMDYLVTVLMVAVGALLSFLPCFYCGCNYFLWKRRRLRRLRDRRREARAPTLERAALPHHRSSRRVDRLAHYSLRSETVSSAHRESLNSVYPEFRPSAPPPSVDIAAEQHFISFKMKAEKSSESCGICLEPFGVIDVTAGQCLHVFHTVCMKAWLAKEGSQQLCPLCRNPFHCTAEHIETFLSVSGGSER